MIILELVAENLKRIKVVRIRPQTKVVEITGPNGAGKTSVLDAIWWALEGASHIQAEPIRRGAMEAKIRLDLGTYKVTRKFRTALDDAGLPAPAEGYTTSVTVENAEGHRLSSPQTMLDALIGALSFDPLAFTRMKPREQFDALKGFVAGVDFDAIEKANKQDYAERTVVNRQAKSLRSQADGIVIPADTPTELVSLHDLIASLEAAGQHNTGIERERASRAKIDRQLESEHEDERDIRGKIAALERELAATLETIATLERMKAEQKPLPEPIDTAEIREAIDAGRRSNSLIEMAEAKKADKARLDAQAEGLEKQSAALTAAIDRRNAEKEQAIAAAAMPVPGIGFGDGFVTLNGVPFDQGSDAEQLRASVAIAAALSPELRVIRVRDGSLLDANGWKLLQEFAEKQDFQIWAESVSSGRPGAVVLEDGEVKP